MLKLMARKKALLVLKCGASIGGLVSKNNDVRFIILSFDDRELRFPARR